MRNYPELRTCCRPGGCSKAEDDREARLPVSLKWKPRLEALDGRIVPDATPVVPTGTPTPQQPPAAQQAVTDVAAIPQMDSQGNSTGLAMIMEKAGSVYILSFYDNDTNTIYTGTASLGDSIQLIASPELDELVQFAGGTGDLTTLQFTSPDGQPLPAPQTNSGLPPTLAQLPGQPANQGPAAVMIIPGFLQQPNTPVQWVQTPGGQIVIGQPPQIVQPPVIGQPPIQFPNQSVAQQIRLGQNIPIIRNILYPPQPQRFIQTGNGGVYIRTR